MADEEKIVTFTEAEYEADLTRRWTSAKEAGKREMAQNLDSIIRDILAQGLAPTGVGFIVKPEATQRALNRVMEEIGSWAK